MSSRKKIKLAYCVAYDWYLLRYSLPQVYNDADEICLSIDKNKKSWTGNDFDFDELSFQQLINDIDTEGKIKIYRDDFSVPELSPMQNEVRQRNMMAAFLGAEPAWFLQLDADEYFLNFSAFCSELHSIRTQRKVNVCCPFVILFKQTADGFLYIRNQAFEKQEMIPIATNAPAYEFGRKNGYFNIITNHAVLHQSWARSEDEIKQKLQNWGHNKDFDLDAYYKFWHNLNIENYHQIKNFHPFSPAAWESLELLHAHSIEDLIQLNQQKDFFRLSASAKALKNSIWYSRFKNILAKFKK